MHSDFAAIGVFDSGFGGLSVARALRARLPELPILYAADCANAPWGDRSEDYIGERADAMTQFLLAHGACAIVIACNTATAVAHERLSGSLSVPVFGIEPALAEAAAETSTGVIATLATRATIASGRYQRRKADMLSAAPNLTVLDQPCPGLMECVERGEFMTERTLALVERYLTPLLAAGADELILGCTHYPFLWQAILDAAHRLAPDRSVRLVHPEARVAAHIEETLARLGMLTEDAAGDEKTAAGRNPNDRFFAVGANAERQAVLDVLWGRGAKLEALNAV